MADQKEFTVNPRTRFSDIIVPTIDTTRANFMVELLVTNSKPVSYAYASIRFYTCICTCMKCTYMYSTCASTYMYMYILE